MSGRRRWFASVRHRVWGRALTAVTAMTAVLALGAPLAVADGVTGYHFTGKIWYPKPLPVTPAVGSHNLSGHGPGSQAKGYKALGHYQAAAPAWPAAGRTTVALTRALATPSASATAIASASASARPGTSASATARARSGALHASGTGAAASPTAASGTPSAGTAPQTVPASGPVKAGSLPVWVGPVPTGSHNAPALRGAASPTQVQVQVASHAQTLAAGANGMLVGFARADGQSGTGQVQVVIDYSSLAKAYGGGYGARLEAFQVPVCALTTPQVQACRTRTPLGFVNRVGADQITGTLTLGDPSGVASRSSMRAALAPMAASASSSMTMVEISSGDESSQGNYAATSLNPAGTWQTSATGAYTYSYPIDAPAAVGGNAAQVALSYDSQSVDGETSARNAQASWIGDGWNYQPGFVERSYRSCNSLLNSSGQRLLKGSGDECWGGDNATISFGSHSGVLVPITSTISTPNLIQQWALQGDDGTIVQEIKGATNGLYQGVYYRVLTTDGSVAYFGADHSPTGPGASGTLPSSPADSSTNSAWGVPVLHPVSGDPCYSSATDTASKCSSNEGWRWNLDFVVSPTGFVQRYDYSTQTNYYDLGGGQVAASNGSGTLTAYTRGGQLSAVSYGYQLADEQAGRTPAAQIVFNPAQRCQPGTGVDCSQPISASNATNFPDVPYDLNCDSTDSTTLPPGSTSVPAGVCITAAPTFWTTTRLDSITTKVNVSGKGLTPVDSYQLGQVYSDAGGTVDPVTGTTVDAKDAGQLQAVMWLQQITHTGYDSSGNTLTVNPVSFTGTEIDNRVSDTNPAAPPLYRPRISSIQTETGEQIVIQYNSTPCAGLSLNIANADSNTNSCYPVYWAPPGASLPIADWFNKVTVSQVVVSDLTVAAQYNPNNTSNPAGSEAQVSNYTYSGPAWHRDDSAQTDDQYRTWDQFRGFRTVTVTTGTAPEVITRTTTTYLQGMDGDYLSNGTQRSVNIADAAGGSTKDSNWLAGTALETDTYTKSGGSIDAMSITGPITVTQTASVPQTAWTDWNTTDNTGTAPALSTLPPLTAHRTATSSGTNYALLASGTSWRQTKSTTTYDSQGRVSTVDAQAKDDTLGGIAGPLQEDCTTTSYATAPAANPMMLAFPDETTTVTGACGGSSPTLLSAKKVYYGGDGTLANLGTFGQLDAAATGQVTGTQIATAQSAGTATAWQTTAVMSYDGAGRVTKTLDAKGNPTSTAFSPAWTSAGGNTNPTSVTSTNSQGWTTTSTLDPLRGLATENKDANNRITDITYDALGRRTAVWLPGRVTPGTSPESAYPSAPDEKFTYSIDPGAVAAPGGTITSPGAPSSITTNTLRMDGTYSTSITIYDGMLQPRQTQNQPADSQNGRVIADTFYDSHGWPAVSYNPYSEPNNPPSTTLFAANENQVPSETSTSYDGNGRPTASTLWHDAVQQWQSSTAYPGADQTTSTAPAGGPTTQTFTNALGQTVKTVVENTNSLVKLTPGAVIPSGTQLMSAAVRLAMQNDGNLVMYSLATGKSLWATGTNGNPGAYAQFGTDGNLHVYSTTGTQLWSTGLAASSGSVIQLQNDAELDIYNSAGNSVWATPTWQANPGGNPTTSYTYTPAGQVASIQDSAGNTWSYQYNFLGQKIQQTDPDTATTVSYGPYDVLGNLEQETDARGQTLSWQYDWDNRVLGEYTGAWSATPSAANELTGYSYDTLAKGYPTSTTRFVGGANGSAYTQAVTSYNNAYQPTGATLTIPASDGFAAAGQSTAPPSGTVTYNLSSAYDPTTGLLNSTTYQADGNLPAETVSYGYDQDGHLNGFGGVINANPVNYLAQTVYDVFGNVLQANYQTLASGKQVATTAQYDPTTNAVTQTSTAIQGVATPTDVNTYRYNQAGEITAVDDLQNNTTHDTQCFTYDSMQRLTQAWTDSAGLENSGNVDPTVGDIGGCTNTSPQTTTTAPIRTTSVGGPAPYWQTYTYDLLGDRISTVNHDTTGNSANDTTQAIAYAGTDGTTTAALPNQATTVTDSNPTQGTATENFNYLDKTINPGGVNAGDTISRTATSTSPLTSGLTSGGAKLCADDYGSSTTPGSKVDIYTCNGSVAQSWSIGTDGTVRVKGLCLDVYGNGTANGTNIDIYTCNGGANQQWKAAANGSLVNPQSGKCLADPGASTTLGTQLILWTCDAGNEQKWTPVTTGNTVLPGQTQTFTYDAEGRTQSVSQGSGTDTLASSYLYDASGNLLEQTSSKNGAAETRILYLFGGAEQITQYVATKSWTGLRNYPAPLGTTITRTSGGTVSYQMANAQGTAGTAIDASSLGVTRRYYDPYGNPRGTQPSSWISADENHGFLGKPTDTTTGLNLLGARTYDPSTGRFTSPDPLLEAGDPNQMGGYTYAADNPAAGSDPSGLCPRDRCDWLNPTPAPTSSSTSTSSTDTSSGNDGGNWWDSFWGGVTDEASQEWHGITQPVSTGWDCVTGSMNACGTVLKTAATVSLEGPGNLMAQGLAADAVGIYQDCSGGHCAKGMGKLAFIAFTFEATDGAGRAVSALRGASALDAGAAADAAGASDGASAGGSSELTPAPHDPGGSSGPRSKPSDPQSSSASSGSTNSEADAPSKGTSGSKSPSGCSFAPSTLVLLASGSTEPIGQLKVGDTVQAADPATGKQVGGRAIQHVWINHDTDLLDVTVDDGRGHTSLIHTTANHPFWDDTTHTWVRADRLKAGHRLASTHGQHPTVVNAKVTPGAAYRWNLTVQQLHTYYVVAGGVPILVHNSSGPSCTVLGAARAEADTASTITPGKARPAVAEALQLPGGRIYSSPSIRGAAPELHPDVQAILDDIPEVERGVGHGRCGLAVCVSDALTDGFNPTGSRAAAVIVRSSTDNPMHGMPVGPCDSCVALEDAFDITFEGIG